MWINATQEKKDVESKDLREEKEAPEGATIGKGGAGGRTELQPEVRKDVNGVSVSQAIPGSGFEPARGGIIQARKIQRPWGSRANVKQGHCSDSFSVTPPFIPHPVARVLGRQRGICRKVLSRHKGAIARHLKAFEHQVTVQLKPGSKHLLWLCLEWAPKGPRSPGCWGQGWGALPWPQPQGLCLFLQPHPKQAPGVGQRGNDMLQSEMNVLHPGSMEFGRMRPRDREA